MDSTNNNRYDLNYIPPEINDYIHNWETNELLYNIVFERYKISEDQARKIVGIIWKIYFKRTPYPDLAYELSRIILDKETLNYLVNSLDRELFHPMLDYLIGKNNPTPSFTQKIERLIISDALKKYPETGEQLITGNYIKLGSFPDPVRPSIKNWISDYTSHLGYGNHDSMKRGQYLFQEENTRNLSASDRQKLAFILKTFDENLPVTVNVNTKQILFQTENREQIAENRNQRAVNNIIPPARFSPPEFNRTSEAGQKEEANAHLQFSSPQKLPYEKVYQDQPFQITHPEKEEEETEEELPKNVVNLRK